MDCMTSAHRYGELHAHSAFSFLDGASEPEELAAEAARLGLPSLALTDHDGLYGVVRFAQAAKQVGLNTSFGAELRLPTQQGLIEESTGKIDPQADHLVVIARGPEGYRQLSAAIARAHLAAGKKGLAHHTLEALGTASNNEWLVLTGCRKGRIRKLLDAHDFDGAYTYTHALIDCFGRENVAIETTWGAHAMDFEREEQLAQLAQRARLPLVATTNAHYATPKSAHLSQALSALRANASLDTMEPWLDTTAAKHLRSDSEMRYLHRAHPYAVDNAARLAAQTTFDLALVAPNLPPYPVPNGHTEATWLRKLTYEGARERYGPSTNERVPGAYAKIEHELRIIEELGFPGYFLIVYDIVEFCRRQGILAQGRGSAANSAVCYALGITAVDAVYHGLLFERFLTPERDGPPDIDVDIESRRREEVIQYVYQRYDREHAAQVANVITYRSRSAVRDAAKALGFDAGQQNAWSKGIDRWGSLTSSRNPSDTPDATKSRQPHPETHQTPMLQRTEYNDTDRRDGFSPTTQELAHYPADGREDIPKAVINLAEQLRRLPRHLGIHSGGMVLCDRPVIEVCPVEWARMDGRTVLQWDKEDCADAGLVKFDLLGLGMLTALRLAFEHVKEHEGLNLELHCLPEDDPHVYELLQAADTVGIFQVESRAQIATLPRLKPKTFYDIVIEVALIRPGPIQGGSVHPYINRARKREAPTYSHPLLKKSLEKTLGIPLFQEQLMQMAIDTANFTPSEADQLRRAMGSKRSTERMEALRTRLLNGMAANGIPTPDAEDIYNKLKAFADFGFPESHAYSFAYLVYASAWLKAHHPAAFYAGLLGAQPMGFYTPQSLMNDARRHGLTVLPPTINDSRIHAHVEPLPHPTPTPPHHPDPDILNSTENYVTRPGTPVPIPTHNAIRLGLANIRNITEQDAHRIVEARANKPFTSLREFQRRTALRTEQLEALAAAGAFASIGVTRREALWAAGVLIQEREDTLEGLSLGIEAPLLPDMSITETAIADQWATGINPHMYPTQLVRKELQEQGILSAQQVNSWEDGRRISTAGVITHRQRPGTAHGVTFLSLEDETGIVNVICSVGLWNKYRRGLRTAKAAVIRGRVEHADGATNLVAEHFTPLQLRVRTSSRDFQ